MSQQLINITISYESLCVTSNTFENIFLDSLDQVFSDMGIKKEMYRLIEKNFGLARNGIPNELASFAQAVQEILGDSAPVAQIRILESLHKRVRKFKFQSADSDFFAEYLFSLKVFLNNNIENR